MLAVKETNSIPKQSSTSMRIFQNRLQDVKNFSNWSAKKQMLAVSAVGMIFGALLPVVAVALPVAATGAIVALTLFFAYKAVEYAFKGLKWSAEKTAKGAIYTKDKVIEGYECSAALLGKGASLVSEKVNKGASSMADTMANMFHRMSGQTDYLDQMRKEFASEKFEKANEIRKGMEEIFADKGNNSRLVKDILSRISSEIDSKIKESESYGGFTSYVSDEMDKLQKKTERLKVQKEFIHNLNESSFQKLLTQRSLPKGEYFIDSVFSDHYDEIKKVIKECKENHLYSSVSNMFNKAEKKANRPSFKNLTRSISALGRKSPEQSNNLPRSNSLNSVSTESSEAEIGNSTFYVAPPKPPRSSSLDSVRTDSTTVSDLDSKKFATVNPSLLRSNSSSSLTPKLTQVASPKVPRSTSIDSGMSSGPSTPRGQSLSIEELNRGLDEAMKELDLAVSQLPSTKVGENSVHHPAGVKVKMA